MGDSNSRHLAPKASALPTALIPDGRHRLDLNQHRRRFVCIYPSEAEGSAIELLCHIPALFTSWRAS